MSKINVLDFEIANLIAAGEVVERPSSVMKELIENSIDSGADKIVAEIKRGGVAMIRVSDNGCGMEREDLPIALKRHATSKIRSKDDLDAITTLGFRGEALAAISSVSSVTIISKTKEAEIGTMLVSEGGRVTDISEVGAADGTTVVVENLFYNVPARRKFLKKDATEAMNVAALVEKVALSRPDISIQLLIDGNERFKTPGDSNPLNAIYAVFGKDFADKLILADGTANGIRVHGYIGRSDNTRKNRNLQNFFINGRYVKSMTAMAAIEKAYTSYIAPEAFPVCVLFLEMNPGIVDVNVHPAKLEVKFSSEQSVFEAVYYTVKRAIESYTYRAEIQIKEKPAYQEKKKNPLATFIPIGEGRLAEQISIPRPEIKPEKNVQDINAKTGGIDLDKPLYFRCAPPKDFFKNRPNHSCKQEMGYNPTMTPKDSVSLLERYRDIKPEVKEQRDIEYKREVVKQEILPNYKIIGEAFDCYIIVEIENELLVIDKHAAHERIIFEDLKKQKEADGRVASQGLLLPIAVALTPDEISCVGEYKEDFTSIGFDFVLTDTGADITAIPDAITSSDAESSFAKMADELLSGKGNPKITEAIRREKALYQIACKAAIKGGRVYDRSIIEWLVERVISIPDIIVCPHGRQVAYKLKKSELDRQFDRIK